MAPQHAVVDPEREFRSEGWPMNAGSIFLWEMPSTAVLIPLRPLQGQRRRLYLASKSIT
jgi:hypothetical protein